MLLKNVKKNYPENPKDPKTFTEYSNDMRDVCKNIEEYKPKQTI